MAFTIVRPVPPTLGFATKNLPGVSATWESPPPKCAWPWVGPGTSRRRRAADPRAPDHARRRLKPDEVADRAWGARAKLEEPSERAGPKMNRRNALRTMGSAALGLAAGARDSAAGVRPATSDSARAAWQEAGEILIRGGRVVNADASLVADALPAPARGAPQVSRLLHRRPPPGALAA